jgi:hypothetical protein
MSTLVHKIKEAITQFAVTRKSGLHFYFFLPFVIPVPSAPRDEFYSFLPPLTLTVNLIPSPHPPFVYRLF